MNDTKLTTLINILKDMKSAVLAYSGGVDSTFLIKSMQLAEMKALVVTAVSEIRPYDELLTAKRSAEDIGIEHMEIKTDELSNEEFVRNTPERCFICKDSLFRRLSDIAVSGGYWFVLDGSHIEDSSDYRPGIKAAEKYNVRCPLIEAGFSKEEIRKHSKLLGLSTWNKPSSPCLATRIPYGRRITIETIKRIEKAEEFLKSLGFPEIRVRDHGHIALIEISPDKITLLMDIQKRKLVSETLKSLGYTFVSLDLNGYHSGSMNRLLQVE